MPKTRTDVCLTTVTDDAFLSGTLVLLSSFLQNNIWFDGPIVIIHDELSDAARTALARFPNIEFHAVPASLKDKVSAIAASRPDIAHKLPIFYALEAFNLPGYDRVLKLDSDVLCRGDARSLLHLDGALMCAPDISHYRHQLRDLDTYALIDRSDVPEGDTQFANTFNAGVMVLAPNQLHGAYDRLMDQLRPESWATTITAHTDSIILNREFRDRWVPLPEQYNYIITRNSYRWDRIALNDAVFVHYLGKPKPWQEPNPDAAISSEQRIATHLWHSAFAAYQAGPYVTASSSFTDPSSSVMT
jgi:lipopolysaccharide biosynthesis glycosyltransferase